jgi:ABC-type transporter Mla MlaB component
MAMTKIKRRESTDENKIIMRFDVPALNMLIKYALSDIPQKAALANLSKLFNALDLDSYKFNMALYNKINIIRDCADAKLLHSIKEPELIKTYILSNEPDLKDDLDEIKWDEHQLTSSECKYLSDFLAERLSYIYIYQVKDNIISLMESMDKGEFITYYEIVGQLKTELSRLMVKLQDTSVGNGLLRSFNFSDTNFNELIDLIVTKAKKPTASLQTGIRMLNAILAPAFQSGRLYCILGLSGKFKSGTLLNIADQIRSFNPQIVPVENGRRKTILFVTMENSIEETVVRLFDMYSDANDDITTASTDDVIKTLREKGKYQFTDTTGIDIDIRYFANLEINTARLYNLIQELEDNGKKVICLILDYLKRIDSTFDSKGDERIRLSYVAKELKTLAEFFEIPVITAMQINREGNSIVDAAMREDKSDVTRFVGSSNIGSCWDIVEESDWLCIVNLEKQKSTEELYLTFKRVKIRGKKDSQGIDYFNHPFSNEKEIRLETDVDKEKSLSIMSLSSDLESIDTRKLETSVQIRPKISKTNSGFMKTAVLQAITMGDED